VGGATGVVLGILVSKSVEYIAVNQIGTTLLRAAIPAWLVIGCISFAFIVGAISGVLPAKHASNIKTVDALRYE
jgi:putative ABC transport system permease protein